MLASCCATDCQTFDSFECFCGLCDVVVWQPAAEDRKKVRWSGDRVCACRRPRARVAAVHTLRYQHACATPPRRPLCGQEELKKAAAAAEAQQKELQALLKAVIVQPKV